MRQFIHRVFPRFSLCGLAVVFVLSACSPGTANNVGREDAGSNEQGGGEMRSTVFTSSTDFKKGELSGVNADSEGDLRMNSGLAIYETPFIWIPNSAERTVTQLDTRTGKMIGTYPLKDDKGNDCYNPSRTTVDIDGNVWVGCRGTSSYTHRENIKPGDVPKIIDHRVVKVSKKDGSVLISRVVGHAPRALALDAKNHLWVGNSVDDTVWEIDGQTGACYRGEGVKCPKPAIKIADFPYGAAVDQRGHLWLIHRVRIAGDPDLLTEIDTATGKVLGTYGPYKRDGCTSLYGIAVDQLNNVWLGGFSCNDVVKIKGVTGTNPVDGKKYNAGQMIDAYVSGGKASRGVAVDLDGNIWVAMSGTNTASKLSGMDGEILQTLNVGTQPIGVGVDAYSNAWVVNRGSDSVHRINGLNVSIREEISVGDGPYTYSDMLGTALRTITHQDVGFAFWKGKVDSGLENPDWQQVKWQATIPGESKLAVRTRCAPTEKELLTAAWGEFSDTAGQVDCAGGEGRWLEAEVRFWEAKGDTNERPILHSLSVSWQ